MALLISKVVITALVVSALSVIAERISPRAAGILSGYPLGTAISLFFIGVENSAAFAGETAIYAIAGMTALLSFFFAYYHASARLRQARTWVSVALSSAAGMAAFLAVNGLLHALNLSPLGCVIVGTGGILLYGRIFRAIPDARISQRVQLGAGAVIFRAGLAAGVILSVTGLAKIVPPSWAGLFTAFPATVFPLVLILHTTYGAEQAHTVIKNIPSGLGSLVVYALTVSFTYPLFGVYWGTPIGFAAATIYMAALALASRHFAPLRGLTDQSTGSGSLKRGFSSPANNDIMK